jgi:hypothetical protein
MCGRYRRTTQELALEMGGVCDCLEDITRLDQAGV